MLADCPCILFQEVLVVPSLLMISKGLPDGPETVPDEEFLLELLDFWDMSDRYLQGLLVGLE